MEIVNISDARARLPELARRVVEDPQAIVVIENRRLSGRAVLIAEERFQILEAAASMLRGGMEASFQLAGSIATALDDADLDAAVAVLRAEQHAAEVARQAALGG
ncbi:MAG: hypothetical protein ACRELX_02945 [Longimicrobiales bacterium]